MIGELQLAAPIFLSPNKHAGWKETEAWGLQGLTDGFKGWGSGSTGFWTSLKSNRWWEKPLVTHEFCGQCWLPVRRPLESALVCSMSLECMRTCERLSSHSCLRPKLRGMWFLLMCVCASRCTCRLKFLLLWLDAWCADSLAALLCLLLCLFFYDEHLHKHLY